MFQATVRSTRQRALQCAVSALLAGTCLAFVPGGTRADDIGTDIANAFKQGQFNVSFRYRYEYVQDDNPTLLNDSANASTLRSRLTYKTGTFEDFAALIEMDDIRPIGNDDFNSTRNGKTDRPTVADPEVTDLNQAYLQYTGFDRTSIIVGRQKIARGNERFVSPSSWRQNEQSFDAASVTFKNAEKFEAFYAFVDQVNRIYGPDDGVPPGEFDGQTHLADLSYSFGPLAKVTTYGYFLDFDEAPTLSSQTIGLRVAGAFTLNDDFSIPYTAEYATQDDYADNPVNYDADYYFVEAGLKYRTITAKIAYEVLEGSTSPNEAFQTPLATAHAFQGWVDKFATTPTGGIEDTWFLVDFALLGGNVKLRYDDFQAETGNFDYGDEIGIWTTWPVGKYYAVAVKYATFNASSQSIAPGLQDTDKFWVMLSANF